MTFRRDPGYPSVTLPRTTEIDPLVRLAAIVESSDDAIIGKDLDGIIQTWNAGAERIYGYCRDEVVGRSMALLLPPDRPDEEAEILARIRSGLRVDHHETVRLRKDGRRIHVSVTVSPILTPDGRVAGASHVARDISERVRYEEDAARLAAIVESSGDAIVGKDLDGIIQTWNAGAERVYGYTAAEAVGQSIAMLLPPERRDEEHGILARLKQGERVEHFETVRVRKDGAQIRVSVTISPIRDRNGQIRGASHIARDITVQKAIEEQLRQTQKLESLGLLAGGVAHDFNNLLTGIMANASLAAESDGLDPSEQELLSDVVRAAERAAGLTRQLLAYAGKGRFITEVLNLSDLVHDISTLVQSSISRKVKLHLELARDLPPIVADPGQLQQVVMNLVINGAEAMGDRSGTVYVSTRVEESSGAATNGDASPPGRYVVLEVCDTGTGMDQATLARIFDPFFTTKLAGRGLGLAAVRGIVGAHKGALSVTSSPGAGTLFRVLFPVAGGSPAGAKRARPRVLEGRATVLVVDDEDSVRVAARKALEHYGYTVIVAENGRHALEIVRSRKSPIDLVLLDLTMPELNGEETLVELHRIQPSLRVLLSSGFDQTEVAPRFSGKTVAGIVQKPYTAARLAQMVKDALR
jgi:PAS domain S-box-containing protein